jgi:hypothetical protein
MMSRTNELDFVTFLQTRSTLQVSDIQRCKEPAATRTRNLKASGDPAACTMQSANRTINQNVAPEHNGGDTGTAGRVSLLYHSPAALGDARGSRAQRYLEPQVPAGVAITHLQPLERR